MRITKNITSVCPKYTLKKVSKISPVNTQLDKERERKNEDKNHDMLQKRSFENILEKKQKEKNDSPKVFIKKKEI
ncbi:MAG: hypothetical protein HFJ11_03190 [Bacilli bacterium]|nr:hypothetical protein [Bacilli bacterium]